MSEQQATEDTGITGQNKAALAMFGLLLLTYVLMVADRFLISMLASDIKLDLNIDSTQMFALTTMFTFGLGIAGLPGAALMARFSRKTVLLLGLTLLSVATLAFTIATGFKSMFVFIVLQGMGMSFLATAMFALSTSFFAKNRVAALGMVNLCFGLGSLLGHRFIGEMQTATGSWEMPMLYFGFAGLLFAVLIIVFVRPWFSETKAAAKHMVDNGGADTLKNYNTILLAIMSALYGLVVYGFLGAFPSYLSTELSLSGADKGAVMMWFGVGGLTSYYGGKLGDKFSSKSVLFVGSLALAVVTLFLFKDGMSLIALKVVATLVGVFGAAIVYTNLAGGHVKSLRRTMTGKGAGMFVTSVYGGATIAGYTMGLLKENYGWATAGLIQISLISAIVGILALFIRENEFSK